MEVEIVSNSDSDNGGRGIAVVCPFSTGQILAERVKSLGFKLVLVFASPRAEGNGVLSCPLVGDAEIVHEGSVQETAQKLRDLPFPVMFVLPGADNGVCLADSLAHELDVLCNPIELSSARRNKYLMGEQVRACGVRAAKQTIATEWEVVEKFLVEWNPDPFKVIVKPVQSAGSDDVFFCTDLEQVRAAFTCINGTINEMGEVNEGVLIQEFLDGVEYVVDSVSLNGVHKVVAIWQYDKRSANGQFNVYFAMSLCAVTSDLELSLVEYNSKVLDALQINNGPSHAEIMMTKTGPCLVEVGSRCHGGHGSWLPIVNAAFGVNQVDAALDCYVRPENFAKLPMYPTEQKMYGKEAFLVSHREGTVVGMPGLAKVLACPSFLSSDIAVKPGDKLRKTVDLFTMPGRVQFLHKSKEQVQEDFEMAQGLLKAGRFFFLESDKEMEAQAELTPNPAEV